MTIPASQALVVLDEYAPLPSRQSLEAMAALLVTSPHTARMYASVWLAFLGWQREQQPIAPPLSRLAILAYLRTLREWRHLRTGEPRSPKTLNAALAALKKLAEEAHTSGRLSEHELLAIRQIPGEKVRGRRIGRWLSREQTQAILDLPDLSHQQGLRDRTILALLFGCGLRRAELVALTREQVQQRDGRWAVVDIHGKGGRIRSVPMPSFAKVALDAWCDAVGIPSGNVWRAFRRSRDHNRVDPTSQGLSTQAVYDVLLAYSTRAGTPVHPHDARRTHAKLARKGGAALEQIQLSLGHASIVTTQLYTAMDQDFTDAPCDHLELR